MFEKDVDSMEFIGTKDAIVDLIFDTFNGDLSKATGCLAVAMGDVLSNFTVGETKRDMTEDEVKKILDLMCGVAMTTIKTTLEKRRKDV